MAKPPRDRSVSDSRTYATTTRTWQGRSFFQSERLARLFLDTLFGYRDQGKFAVHEFAVMPTHVHLMFTVAAGVTVERAMQFIKGGFSHRAGEEVGRNKEIWQRGYVDRRIPDAGEYARWAQYMRQNSVRAGLARAPELYPYPVPGGTAPLDWPSR